MAEYVKCETDEERIALARSLLEEEIVPEELEYEDLYHAMLNCNLRKATTYSAEQYELNSLLNLNALLNKINNRTFRPNPLYCFIINDPTTREVWASEYEDRILHHFMLLEIVDILEAIQGDVCYNCRTGLGTDKAIAKVCHNIRKVSQNYTIPVWYIKGDFSAFFMSLDKVILLQMVYNVLDTYYRGKYPNLLKWLFRLFLLRDPTDNASKRGKHNKWETLSPQKSLYNRPLYIGMEIGVLLAQNLCNLYLLDIFDSYVSGMGFEVVRYVDDWIITDSNKERLGSLLPLIEQKISSKGLSLNQRKTKIRNAEYGIEFLGKKIYPYNVVWQQKTIDRLYANSKTFKTSEQAYQSTVGRRGIFLRYGGIHMAFRWYNSLPEGIRMRFYLNSDMTCTLISKEDYRRKHKMDIYQEILLKYPTINMQEYSMAVFIASYSHRPACVMTAHDYRSYFKSECHIYDPVAYHINLIKKGYFRKCTARERLALLTMSGLTEIASHLGIPSYSSKKRTIDSIIEVLDQNLFDSFLLPDTYNISDKGMQFIEENRKYLEIHKLFRKKRTE